MYKLLKDGNNNYLIRFSKLYNHPAIVLWRSIEVKHLSQILKQINLDGLILDLGCGEGKVSSIIFGQTIDIGLDTDPVEIRKAQSTKSYKCLIVGDGCSLPFGNESFDLIFSNCVIEHIPHVEDVLREVSRVLKYRGHFVFSVPSENFGDYLFFNAVFNKLGLKKVAQLYSFKRNQYLHHYNVFTEDIWKQKLEDVNLRMIKTEQYLSKSAMEIWDLLAFLGFLYRKFHLNKIEILGKLLPSPRRTKLRVFKRILKRYYEEECNKGGGLLIVSKKIK
jgi:SAM-dependent methyltransferase